MRTEGGVVTFEHLVAVNSSSVGEDTPITAKPRSASFLASNAPGEPKECESLEHIECLGKDAVANFNAIFA